MVRSKVGTPKLGAGNVGPRAPIKRTHHETPPAGATAAVGAANLPTNAPISMSSAAAAVQKVSGGASTAQIHASTLIAPGDQASPGEARVRALGVAGKNYAGGRAKVYTRDVNYTGGPDQLATKRYLAKIPKDLSGLRVLDVGCGEGKLPNEVLAQRNPTQITGVDASLEFVKQARAEAGPNARFERMDMHRMSLRTSSQDFVMSRFALHYSPDLSSLFDELARVLKPGGEVLFITNMARGARGGAVPSAVRRDRWIPIRLSPELTVDNLAHGEADYLKALGEAGFVDVELERFDANHKIDASYPHKGAIDLNAVIVRARLKSDAGA